VTWNHGDEIRKLISDDRKYPVEHRRNQHLRALNAWWYRSVCLVDYLHDNKVLREVNAGQFPAFHSDYSRLGRCIVVTRIFQVFQTRSLTSGDSTSATDRMARGEIRSRPARCSSANWRMNDGYVLTSSGWYAFNAVTTSGIGVVTDNRGASGLPTRCSALKR